MARRHGGVWAYDFIMRSLERLAGCRNLLYGHRLLILEPAMRSTTSRASEMSFNKL